MHDIAFYVFIQGVEWFQKLFPCFRTFREAFSHPYISFFHLLVNGFFFLNIGGKMVRYVAHEADYIRLEALLKVGGLISDFDVVVVNGTLSASIF